ncbi:hypothetical protein [Xanthobacter sp. KR7-225]|uniref:hypothetical protein n=1 Tax=Xanthobacter sp. KR7-225 TaxID=3156613 RepID=UPI0032B329E7
MSRRVHQLRAKVARAQRAHRDARPALADLRRALHAQLRAEIAAERDRRKAAASGQLTLNLSEET